MSQLFISIVGHNSSGKTTLAKKLEAELGLNRVSGDDFRDFVCHHISYFRGTDWSYPNDRTQELNPLVIDYRLTLAWLVLRAGQHVVFDGSGNTAAIRASYLDQVHLKFPDCIRIIIWADLAEQELLARLRARGKQWEQQYQDIRQHTFEPPKDGEADIVLRYDQQNYDEIVARLRELLSA